LPGLSSAANLPGPSSAPPAQPASCAQPNIPAATIEAAVPQTPPLAAQQNISGLVTVIVSLDAASHVIGARVLASPSALLNDAALQAARTSTFRTEVRDCRPVAADYAFIVEFTSQ
jgi:TonB family protein